MGIRPRRADGTNAAYVGEPDHDLAGRPRQGRMQALEHADATVSGQAAPAGMGRGDKAALRVGVQQGQAVRHHDGASHAGFLRVTGVGLRTLRRVYVQRHHATAMYLLQEYGPCTEGLRQHGAVGAHGQRIVADVVAEVEAVVGRP